MKPETQAASCTDLAPWRTRFAPAPTGYLHLGHVVSALHVWGLARAFGGEVVLRVEDHDRVRSRPEYEAALLDDLAWLGLEAEAGTAAELRAGATRWRQSDNAERYAAALERLEAAGMVYACTCSRREIQEALAARRDDGVREELLYPGTCRQRGIDPASTAIRRLYLPRSEVTFDDLALGSQHQVPVEQCGDLLLRDRDGHWSYQFAVTVDDFEQHVDVVIRGEDLLASTGRQVQLARLLGRDEPPLWFHHPLVLREDGEKLSKSAGDSGVRELRDGGWSREQVLGEAALRAGLLAADGRTAPRLAIDELPDLIRHHHAAAGARLAGLRGEGRRP